MSLQVWLPLNGDLHNQGLSNINLTNTVIFATPGKIGASCLNSQLGWFAVPEMAGKKQMSFAYWVKLNAGTTTNWLDPFSWYSTNGTSSHRSRQEFYYYNSGGNTEAMTTGVWYYNQSNSGLTQRKIGQWYHYVFTIDYATGITQFFVDGVLWKTTTNADTNYYVKGDNFLLRESSLDCSINDFRLYDHILSAKEVEEIARGLVLHYKLDNNGLGGENLALGTSIATTSFKTYNLKSTIPDGTKVTISCRIDADNIVLTGNKRIGLSTAITNSNGSGTTWFETWASYGNGKLVDNGSFHGIVSNTTTIPGDMTKISTYVQTLSSGTVSISQIKVEIGDKPTPWSPASSEVGAEGTIYDSSGYGHHGIPVGTITATNPSPRYGVAASFAASSAINCGRSGMVTDSITVNVWVKYSSYSNLVSCTEGGGWNFENNSGLTFPVYVSGVGYVHIDSASRPVVANYANEWHMFTGVYDRVGQQTRLYIDGELIGTGTVSSPNPIQYHSSNVIWLNAEATGSDTTGSYGNAKQMSDFRIYATALTPTAIQELYHTSATIDNHYNGYSYELQENGLGQITKQGIMNFTSFYELDNLAKILATKDFEANQFYEY